MMLRCFFYPSHAPELDWHNSACVWNFGQSFKLAWASAPFSLRGEVSLMTELRIATWIASSSSAHLRVRSTQRAQAFWASTCVEYLSICSHVLAQPHTLYDETMLLQKISLFSYIFVMLNILNFSFFSLAYVFINSVTFQSCCRCSLLYGESASIRTFWVSAWPQQSSGGLNSAKA